MWKKCRQRWNELVMVLRIFYKAEPTELPFRITNPKIRPKIKRTALLLA